MILKNRTSAPVRKERLSPMSKARREARSGNGDGIGGAGILVEEELYIKVVEV